MTEQSERLIQELLKIRDQSSFVFAGTGEYLLYHCCNQRDFEGHLATCYRCKTINEVIEILKGI